MAQLKDTIILGDLSATGTIYGNLIGNSSTANTATKTGTASIYLYAENNNEINIGGSNTEASIYIGHRAKDSRPKPTNYYFGGTTADATVRAATFVGALSGNATTATTATNATNIYSSASTAKAYVLGTTTASNANHATVYAAAVYTQSGVLYGAAWNDYAEYRELREDQEIPYGRVVIENGDDTLSLSTERLQPGGHVVSDTFGFAIGETDKCKLPIAVSGRALVYTYEDRNTYKPGDAVCTGPKGTVSKMSREEIKEYPEHIIGTVSAVPDYENWGTGNVAVDGRIWIYIK